VPLISTTYSYGKPAVIADVAGSWTGNTLGSTSSTTLTISNSGALSGNSSGRLISGSIIPRASGKSVFDMALAFGSAPCALPGQSARGIALSYLLTSGKRQFILAGVTPSRNSGAGVSGAPLMVIAGTNVDVGPATPQNLQKPRYCICIHFTAGEGQELAAKLSVN